MTQPSLSVAAAPQGNQFVCVFNRNRDGYQVPLALQEAGLLARFVTDFYARERAQAWLPGPLRRRRVDGLPASKATGVPSSFALQAVGEVLSLPMAPIFAVTDRLLASNAARVAARRSAHLYSYANYLPPERAIALGTRRIVFEYHPRPELTWDLLIADHQRFPQTRWSFDREMRGLDQVKRDQSWRRADAVVCASTMTQRSLEFAGCDPALITVIPYGIDLMEIAETENMRPSDADTAEFLFVGQGIQRKGLHHLIEAWQASTPKDARLTIVCYDIDPGIRAMIHSDTIRLLGRQSSSELNRLYRQSDVFVMPSLIEGFGLVYLEALARGCHVIGTANTGLPDLGLPAHALTLVDAGDIAALSDVLAARRDDILARRLDRAMIRGAATAWSWSNFRRAIAEHAHSVLMR